MLNASTTSIILPILTLFLLHLLQTALQDNSPVRDASHPSPQTTTDVTPHAFVQTGTELHYIRGVTHQELLISSFSLDSPDRQGIAFRSPFRVEGDGQFRHDVRSQLPKKIELFGGEKITDFGATHIGVPVSKTLYVFNPTKSTNINLYAISSSASNFHCSFFDTRELQPNTSVSFQVFFLPSSEGLVEDVILVHTSAGKFSHSVRGEGAGNPYRLRPVHGARIPLNASLTLPISMHNPHPGTLRVLEMFSSDPIVHVGFGGNGDGGDDGQSPQIMRKTADGTDWLLAPYETQTINHMLIVGGVERNTTSFVHIRAELLYDEELIRQSHRHEGGGMGAQPIVLLIPIEIVVTRKSGIYSARPLLDFGMLREGEVSKQLDFEVFTNIERGLEVDSVYVSSSNTRLHGLHLQYASHPPIAVRCGPKGQPGPRALLVHVSVDTSPSALRYDDQGEVLNSENDTLLNSSVRVKRGVISAESRGGNFNVSVPYEATIYRGELAANPDDTAFNRDLEATVTRSIRVTNTLPFAVAIWNATIEGDGRDVFEARIVSAPGGSVCIEPSQTVAALTVSYVKKRRVRSTHCVLHTNVSTFTIPIVMFSGRIKVALNSLSGRKFDFGALKLGERRSILFTITNPNPVAIAVKQLHQPLGSRGRLQIVGVAARSPSSLVSNTYSHTSWLEGHDFVLPADSISTFNLSLILQQLPWESGAQLAAEGAKMSIRTAYQHFTFPVEYEVWNCSLACFPRVVDFHNSFIGTAEMQAIRIHSTCSADLRVKRVSIAGNDTWFRLSRLAEAPVIRGNGRVSSIGNLSFIPEASCHTERTAPDCYVGIPLDSPDGQWFTYGMKLPQNLAEIDYYLFGRLRKKWVAMESRVVATSLLLDTDRVKQFEIPVRGHLVWPRLLSHPIVHFPLTPVGNFSIVNLTLSNPSTRPVIVQLLPLVIYPDADALLELFQDQLPAPVTDPVELNETLMFTLRDTELFTLRPGSPIPQLREEVEKVVGSPVPRFTLSMILRPGMSARIRIGFLPSDYNLHSSLLLIRNNLTALETAVLYGRGTQINMQIDNKTARGEPLIFDIQPSHLVDCFNPRRHLHKLPTTLTVKRSFVVKNSGDVSFSVVNVSISNIACENRGFRVLNCQPFRLEPGDIHTLDIAYTPDFLQSVNEGNLQIYMHMNGTPWVFDMAALVPKHMLSLCHSALPRPPFERVMYHSCISALVFCLICTISCAYLEGDRVITCAIRQQFLKERKVFDLNAIDSKTAKIGTAAATSKDKRSFVATAKKLRNKNYVKAEADSSALSKAFWRSANCILWLVSHIWLTIRSDELDHWDGASVGVVASSSSTQHPARTGEAALQHAEAGASLDTRLEVHEVESLLKREKGSQKSKKRKGAAAKQGARPPVSMSPADVDGSALPVQQQPKRAEVSGGLEGKEEELGRQLSAEPAKLKVELAPAAEPAANIGAAPGECSDVEEAPQVSDEEMPEWADDDAHPSNLNGGDFDRELEAIASQTAALFEKRPHSKASSHPLSSEGESADEESLSELEFNNSSEEVQFPTFSSSQSEVASGRLGPNKRVLDNRLSGEGSEDLSAIKEREVRSRVEQMTRDYRQLLIQAALRGGIRELTGIGNDPSSNLLGSRQRSLRLPSSSSPTVDPLQELLRNTAQILGEDTNTEMGVVRVAIGAERHGHKDENTKMAARLPLGRKYNAMFYTNDPIWRPIFEDGESECSRDDEWQNNSKPK